MNSLSQGTTESSEGDASLYIVKLADAPDGTTFNAVEY